MQNEVVVDVADMTVEVHRVNTFTRWPVSFLRPRRMAEAGFYYLGRDDEVRCAFCKIEMMRWAESDDPAVEHKRWAPQCLFARNLCNNLAVGQDECGNNVNDNSGDILATTTTKTRAMHPHYASEAVRLRTFKDWPRGLKQRPEELAKAGFYYTGRGDKTKCFYCDGGLQDWEKDDVPWEQHARWFNTCGYVRLVKGADYVQRVISEACVIREPTKPVVDSAPVTTNRVDNITDDGIDVNNSVMKSVDDDDDSKLCKICYNAERTVCCVPCGHVVACGQCAVQFDHCPACRCKLETVVRMYRV
ncbi:IAP3 [Orgyia pseudotsugata single capsid nuclopolyhedrovirus]|nr:IAP3 [Orgyia pseudotsugata single capsid nuclopolyhedrovirus]